MFISNFKLLLSSFSPLFILSCVFPLPVFVAILLLLDEPFNDVAWDDDGDDDELAIVKSSCFMVWKSIERRLTVEK